MPILDSSTSSQQRVAAEFVSSLISGSNQTLMSFALAAATYIKGLWQPGGTTTQHILLELGTEAADAFDESEDAVAYLWSKPKRRADFQSACAQVGLELTEVNGLPVFPAILPVIVHEDGSVTLTQPE